MGWELDRTWCEGLHFDVLAETSGNESENGSPKLQAGPKMAKPH